MRDVLENILNTLEHSVPERSMRWMNLENLHITLQFLEKVWPEDVNPLIKRVRTELKNTSVFELQINQLEWFPEPKHPKILSLAVGPQEILKALSDSIGYAISSLNYSVESRPYRGHMSIGRLSQHRSQHPLLPQIKVPIIPAILIDEIFLIESKPGNGKNSYYPLAQFNLS